MSEKVIILPPYKKWSPKFKKTFFEKFNDISEEDIEYTKEIRVLVNDNKYYIEIEWKTDVVEFLKKELPSSVKKELLQ